MLVLVALETAVVVLLVVLVAGLLRSHADVLRALHALGARIGDPAAPDAGSERAPLGGVPGTAPGAARGTLVPTPVPGPAGRRAPDLVGVTPAGEAVGIAGGGTEMLVAFLSSGCGTCAGFWQALAGGAAGALAPARVVAVTRDPAEESPSALARLAPPGGPGEVAVVMSSAAWDDYGVPGSPYFVHVDGQGRVTGEGTASRWDQLVSLFRQAGQEEREARADRELLAAGIHPGHPSLFPERLS